MLGISGGRLPPDHLFDFDLTKCPVKFEIFYAERNPKLQLMALASRAGEVVVKRAYWKTAWKKNLAKECPLRRFEQFLDPENAAQSSTKDQLAVMRWSPDGQLLLVGFQSGRIFYIDVQTGRTVWMFRVPFAPTWVRWWRILPTRKISSIFSSSFIPTDGSGISLTASDLDFNDNASREHSAFLAEVEPFCRALFSQSLAGTLLCVARANAEEAFVELYAGGVFLVKRVDVHRWLSEEACKSPAMLDPGTIELVDVEFDKSTKKLHFLVKFLSFGQPYVNEQPPGVEMTAKMQKSCLELTLNIDELFPVFAKLAQSMIWLIFHSLYFREMLQLAVHNWQQSSELFHQRLLGTGSAQYDYLNDDDGGEYSSAKKPPVEYKRCRDLFMLISAQYCSPSLKEFLEREPAFIKKELQIGNTFVDDHFTIFLTGLYSGLEPATCAFRHAAILIGSFMAELNTLLLNNPISNGDASSSLSRDNDFERLKAVLETALEEGSESTTSTFSVYQAKTPSTTNNEYWNRQQKRKELSLAMEEDPKEFVSKIAPCLDKIFGADKEGSSVGLKQRQVFVTKPPPTQLVAFEKAIMQLSCRLTEASTIAEQNRCELKHLLRWLEAMVRDFHDLGKSDEAEVEPVINLKLVTECLVRAMKQFHGRENEERKSDDLDDEKSGGLMELIELSHEYLTFRSDPVDAVKKHSWKQPHCVLDRVLPFIVGTNASEKMETESGNGKTKNDDDERVEEKALEKLAEHCFDAVRELCRNGATKIVPSLAGPDSFRVLSNESVTDEY